MNIALLGLGLMGLPIALRLQQQGFDVTGWNRSEAPRQRAAAAGLGVSADLSAALAPADLVILTLSDAAAVEQVLFPSDEMLPLAGKMLLQMGTIAPDESRALAAQAAAAGAGYLEAPVLGSIPEARAGRLIIMAGGDEALYQRCLPLLQQLGQAPQRIGDVGQGAALKLAMNQLIASLTGGFSLSLGLVQAEGIQVEQFMSLLRASALYAPTFDKKLGKMLGHDYANPNFPLKHLLKDVRLFCQVAERNGIDTALPQAMESLLELGQRQGHGDDDYSALYEAVNPPATVPEP